MKRKIEILLVSSLAIVTLAAVALAGFLVGAASRGSVFAPFLSANPKFANATELQGTFERVFSQVSPSVVKIVVVARQVGAADPSAASVNNAPAAVASGFVYDAQGDIVTNNHVVAAAGQIQITFPNGDKTTGQVIGADPDSDLAVVKTEVIPGHPPARLADPASVKVGQLAIVIGSPFGQQNTLSTGIVSALGRSLPVGGQNAPAVPYTIPDVIQTDAPINPGSSGGVLLDADGNVVGVISAYESIGARSTGVGFAIPSGIVAQVVPSLIATGHFAHPYLGISGATLTPSLAQAMGMQASQRGALVTAVAEQGPAAKAGVRGATQQVIVDGVRAPIGGDVIIAMNGQPVMTSDDLATYLAGSLQPNQNVALTILRGGSILVVQVTLEPRPAG